MLALNLARAHLALEQAWPAIWLLSQEMSQAAHFVETGVNLVHQLHDLQTKQTKA